MPLSATNSHHAPASVLAATFATLSRPAGRDFASRIADIQDQPRTAPLPLRVSGHRLQYIVNPSNFLLASEGKFA
jgi:hypothetical protein